MLKSTTPPSCTRSSSVRAVELVVFSPDGALLAAATDDGEIRLWRTADRQMVGVYAGHRGIVWSVCFSPDGRHIASGAEDSNIYIWDVGTQQISRVLAGHNAAIGFIAWSPDGA